MSALQYLVLIVVGVAVAILFMELAAIMLRLTLSERGARLYARWGVLAAVALGMIGEAVVSFADGDYSDVTAALALLALFIPVQHFWFHRRMNPVGAGVRK